LVFEIPAYSGTLPKFADGRNSSVFWDASEICRRQQLGPILIRGWREADRRLAESAEGNKTINVHRESK